MKDVMAVTNNLLAAELMGRSIAVHFIHGGYRDVLIVLRDMVHIGHRLYMHPLYGSIKPDVTPYRTVLLSEKIHELSLSDIQIISNSITVCDGFPPADEAAPERLLEELRLADISLICPSYGSARGNWHFK